ncbi:hypothetical protein C8T65DRAFT_641688 [Cerioporus squamosus]|nr:hypothetical protein C8T65DRAFT_641688 [Cerioporus squamosus]
MGSWNFLNITLREVGRTTGGEKWLEFFYNPQYFLVRSLTLPYPSDKVDAWLEGFTATAPRINDQGLLRFPNELLMNIIELVPDVRDKVCLALTCRRLLSLSHDGIEELKKQLAAPWAGGRIICLCEYTNVNDLPKSLLTQEEKSELKSDRKLSRYGGLRSLLDKHTPLFVGTYRLNLSRDKNLQNFLAPFSKPDRERFCELYGLHYPARDDWVVCNLTLGKYVRAKPIAELSKKPDACAPFLPRCSPDLGHVIMYRIYWSSDGFLGAGCDFYRYKGNIARGSWAGHKFAITTMERMPDAPEGIKWEDISEQVAKDLEYIWSESPL